jgi:hypothetical protein
MRSDISYETLAETINDISLEQCVGSLREHYNYQEKCTHIKVMVIPKLSNWKSNRSINNVYKKYKQYESDFYSLLRYTPHQDYKQSYIKGTK